MTPDGGAGEPTRRSPAALAALLVSAGVVFLVLLALGTWQVRRLSWKLDLIARVDARVTAPPALPPGPNAWPSFDPEAEEYRHVAVTGRFLNDHETLVQAVTELGGGDWVLTPFVTDPGFTVLVNRGFVPPERRAAASRASGEIAGTTTVTGLMRLSEPGGGFLRHNDAQANRWFSRDVTAIVAARSLGAVAPYFIDADAAPNPGGYPVGGLTVVAFPNNHLVYALTWFGLAVLLAGAMGWVVREDRRARRSEAVRPRREAGSLQS